MTEAIEYLEKFVMVAESAQLSRSLVDACISLGDIYNERVSISYNDDALELIVIQDQNLCSCMRDCPIRNLTNVLIHIGISPILPND